MNLTISGHHLALTPPISEYMVSKLERITRHFNHVISLSVTLSIDKKFRQRAEISLHCRGQDLHCEAAEENLYAAIDAVVDKLDRQVIKVKELRIGRPTESPRRSWFLLQGEPVEAVDDLDVIQGSTAYEDLVSSALEEEQVTEVVRREHRN